MPRCGNTKEGKKHVATVPIKLVEPEASLRKKIACMYAKFFIDEMFEIAKVFGPHAIPFISNNDKAKAPLGLSAANLQAPLLIHLEYKMSFPDYDP